MFLRVTSSLTLSVTSQTGPGRGGSCQKVSITCDSVSQYVTTDMTCESTVSPPDNSDTVDVTIHHVTVFKCDGSKQCVTISVVHIRA